MRNQRLVALGQILLRVALEVAEGRRQAVTAMQLGHAAQRPQRILQALGKRDIALAAEHHVGVLEAREREAEVIEPVVERAAGDRHLQGGHVGEVGEPHTAWRMVLGKHHVLFGAVKRAPLADAPLQRPAHAFGQLRISSNTATARMPGAASSRGTTSASHRWAIGSGRRRPRGFFFCDGNRGSAAIR